MKVLQAVESALLVHVSSMKDVELTNALLGLAAMQTELSKLSPEVVELLQKSLSERTAMPSDQRIEAQQA